MAKNPSISHQIIIYCSKVLPTNSLIVAKVSYVIFNMKDFRHQK